MAELVYSTCGCCTDYCENQQRFVGNDSGWCCCRRCFDPSEDGEKNDRGDVVGDYCMMMVTMTMRIIGG